MGSYSADKALSVLMARKNQMTKEEFKEWVENFDLNKDGKISRDELQAAVRTLNTDSSPTMPSNGREKRNAPKRNPPVRSAPTRSPPIRSAPIQSAPIRSPPIHSTPIQSAKGSQEQMFGEEFKKWLMMFDKDKDGRISRDELREAMHSCGVWFFLTWRAGRMLNAADTDRSGYIDDDKEIRALLGFAEQNLGFKFK